MVSCLQALMIVVLERHWVLSHPELLKPKECAFGRASPVRTNSIRDGLNTQPEKRQTRRAADATRPGFSVVHTNRKRASGSSPAVIGSEGNHRSDGTINRIRWMGSG
jgi:hypothetical protein